MEESKRHNDDIVEPEARIRYAVKLKNGELKVSHSKDLNHTSIYEQINRGNQFICFPKMVIAADDISYVDINVIK